ncbi:MAG: hypothetical protein H7Z72_12685 [Bacteroidetes bacterium]|nr:hypothetical protein [Fibrella sp.]
MTSTVFANPGDPAIPSSFNTSLYITKANKIHLAIEKTAVGQIMISLRPVGSGQLSVFSQAMRKKQDKLALELDVSALADGVYELEVKSTTGQMTRQITLATPARQSEAVRTIVMPPLPVTKALLSAK